MMNRHSLYIIFLFVWLKSFSGFAQLNFPERILLDSLSYYPEFGFMMQDGYLIGGEEGSCHQATIWKLDKEFNIIARTHLVHDSYQISEIYDMRMRDSSIEVLTRQLETEDVVSDDGIKWYSLNPSLEIVDSLYIPKVGSYDGVISDSSWIIKTQSDSLLNMSSKDGKVLQKISFKNGFNDLIRAGPKTLSWQYNSVFIVDSSFEVDTIHFSEEIIGIQPFSDGLYVLSTSHIWLLKEGGDNFIIKDSVEAPVDAASLLFHPYIPSLVVFTSKNEVYFYDDVLNETGMVQLFFDPVYAEDLYYRALEDGSILRLGTTYVKLKTPQSLLYGQEFGFVQQFDQAYSEDLVSRSNISLEDLSLTDTYYGAEPVRLLGDTTYIIIRGNDSKLNWKISNSGTDTIQSALVSTNALWGFNCLSAFHSNFLYHTFVSPGDSLAGTFPVYENSNFPDGWESNHFLYTAYPNNHYDADFTDNLRRFKLRYIITSNVARPDPDEIQIYPNPAYDVFHITTASDYIIQKAVILDIHGKMIATINRFSGQTIRLPESIANGIYFLKLETSRGHVVKKVMVMK